MRLKTIIAIFLLAILGLVGGVVLRLFVERIGASHDAAVESKQAGQVAFKEDPGGLCIGELNIQSDLSSSQYQFEKRDINLILVTRDGSESFFVVIPDPEEDHREKYSIPEEPDFFALNLGAGVNEIIEEHQTSYFVDQSPPFFVIFLPNTPDDQQAQRDVEQFLDSMGFARCGLD